MSPLSTSNRKAPAPPELSRQPELETPPERREAELPAARSEPRLAPPNRRIQIVWLGAIAVVLIIAIIIVLTR